MTRPPHRVPVDEGEAAIRWRRVGTHDVLNDA
jgi:hypothetical protein